MKKALKRTWIELFSGEYVPPHLRRVYPSAFSLFLATMGVAVVPGSQQLGIFLGSAFDIVAWVIAILLFFGWAMPKQSITQYGFWLGAGFWTAVFFSICFTISDIETLIFTGGVSLAMVNLAIGAWVLMRKDPNE